MSISKTFQDAKSRASFSEMTRREMIIGGAASIATLSVGLRALASPLQTGHPATPQPQQHRPENDTVITKDGTRIHVKDWGQGSPIVFSHGWPLNADAWDAQMLFLASHGHRVIAHDRRGHGRSSQPWTGNDLDTYADDLAEVINSLDLKDVMLVGHSTGGGEVTRYVGRHGSKRLSKLVLISAIPPLRLKTASNPGGAPLSAFDELRATVLSDRSQFLEDLSLPFYGYNRPGAKVSQGARDALWAAGMQASIVATYDGIRAQTETDFTGDLKAINIPTLIVHGSDDQLVPIDDSAILNSKIIRRSTLKIYEGAPHGLTFTHADRLNADLLAFRRLGQSPSKGESWS